MVAPISPQVSGPSLRWRINASFDDYVRNQTGDGEVILSDGARRDEDGNYVFPAHAARSEDGLITFAGSVEFRAYRGILALRVAEPQFKRVDDVVFLSVVDDAAPAGSRLDLATATIESSHVGQASLDLRLTERGSDLFLGKYPAGASLAPVTITLPTSSQGVNS